MSALGTADSKAFGTRRRDAMRHLAGLHDLREAARVLRPQHLSISLLVAAQAVLCLVITVPFFELSPWPHLAGFAALGGMAALFGRFAPPRRRLGIVALCALCLTGGVIAMSALQLLAPHPMVALLVLALGAGAFLFLTTSLRFGPPGALIFIFALGAAMSPVTDLDMVLARGLATAVAGALAVAICAASEGLRPSETETRRFPHDTPPALRDRLIAAARLAVGSALAWVLAQALGLDHPAWAVMGTVTVLQGSQLHLNLHRALQRMAGTLAGACIAWAVLDYDPSIWGLIAILAALQLVTEVVIGANYAFGQIFVTALALLMVHLAAPALSGTHMVPERIIDTALGVTIGLVIAVALSSQSERHHLAERKRALHRVKA